MPVTAPSDHSSGATPALSDAVGATIGVLVVSDIRLLRDGLAQAIAASAQLHVAGTAVDLDGALRAMSGRRADLVLLDTSMHGAVETIGELRRAAPDVLTIAFAVDDDDAVIACAEAGVVGYVPRHAGIATLVAVLESAARGEAVCSPHVAGSAALAAPASDRPISATAVKANLTMRSQPLAPVHEKAGEPSPDRRRSPPRRAMEQGLSRRG